MKIGIISESPSATTGFGTVCRYIAKALVDKGHDVVCFGMSVFGEVFDRSLYPYRIWVVGNYQLPDALSEFLKFEDPDILLLNSDLLTLIGGYKLCRELNWIKPIMGHLVVDALPIHQEQIKILKEIQGLVTPTRIVTEYLLSEGIPVEFAPHGVDKTIFFPLPNREALRKQAKLDNKFVVGIFGANTERKQQPRILMTAAHLKKLGLARDLVFYFHCQPKVPSSVGWNLPEIVRQLDVSELVFFPGNEFVHTRGIPYQSKVSIYQREWSQFSYSERMNCCDIVINPSFCGGFELVVVEAQACGVPTCITDDKSMMHEVSGGASYLLEPCDICYRKVGGKQYNVSPETISSAITQLREDKDLRHLLVEKGKLNANKYNWEQLTECLITMLEAVYKKTSDFAQT